LAHIRVLNHYLHTKFLLLGTIEFFMLIVAVYGGVDLTNYVMGYSISLELPMWQTVVFAVVMNCCSLAMGVYTSVFREGVVGMMLRTVVSYFFLGTAGLTIIYYLIPELFLGRGVLVFAISLSLILVLATRYVFFKSVDFSQLSRKVVILGAGNTAKQVFDRIDMINDKQGFRLLGVIPCSKSETAIDSEHFLPYPYDWDTFTKEHNISEVVVAPDERRSSEGASIPVDELLDCKLRGIRVTEPLAFIERELLRIEVSLLRPSWALFSSGFIYSQTRDIIKKVFDISLALLLLVLVWPFMILTALAVYLESGGPVIYKQVRTGLYGKDFSIYKFRSMTQNAEKDGKAVWATKNDARVTRVGAFIRNTRLDELPQLYNVLVGDMSFVGPRPERPEFVEELNETIPFYDARHKVKPGLMGWAQLKYPYGASVEDAQNKLKYDLYYVKNHSFFLDILIVIQTVEVVLLGKGVH
jgi:sugar transferase (PEP-CTERM system associated)